MKGVYCNAEAESPKAEAERNEETAAKQSAALTHAVAAHAIDVHPAKNEAEAEAMLCRGFFYDAEALAASDFAPLGRNHAHLALQVHALAT